MSGALTPKALDEARVRIAARDVARAWRRLCTNTGGRPVVDNVLALPGYEKEKLALVIALGGMTEELSMQDGWESTNPDVPRPA